MKGHARLAMFSWSLLAAVAPPALAAPARPKLVVLLSIDQMRADYVDDYGEQWTRGLHTLLRRGAYFRNARYPYLETLTCPGHTTLGTGAYPHRHGMILNAWWDRARERLVECTEDPASPLVFYGKARPAEGDSARNMMVPTLADEMKKQLGPTSRSVSFSFKARSAIGLVGHTPDLVTWYEAGSWVTAKQFAAAPDPTIAKLIEAHPIEAMLDKPWQRVLPPAAYKGRDDSPSEHIGAGWTREFPHPLRAPGAMDPHGLWERSPLTDEALARLAIGALAALRLGRGPGTDFLAVSFSALDIVGHSFGPRSHEIQDVLARLDGLLGELLAALDGQVGRGGYVLALSSDHGVAVYPEDLRAEGKDAGRIDFRAVHDQLEAALAKELGPGSYVVQIDFSDVYLRAGVMARLHAKPGAVERVAAAVRALPGVLALFAADELGDAAAAADPLRRAAALSYFPGRSGDLMLVPKPYWLTVPVGTTHGTQNDYDQRVPLVLFGAQVKPGRYERAVSPADLAPTLARIVGVTLKQAEGGVLEEAIGR
jgi:predicted AlkP superfamily pyrophosphatase or phosphodiesterase